MIAFICAVGEIISIRTKYWIPSVFIIATAILIGFWTIFPQNIFEIAGISGPMSSIFVMMLIIHMGTTISPKELAKQWKPILIGLAGMAGTGGGSETFGIYRHL